MKQFLLDASAILAVLQGEKGADFVIDIIEQGANMTTLNISEVMSKLYQKNYSKAEINSCINELAINFIDINITIATLAASYYTKTKSLGLSMADKICLATAKLGNYTIITADKDWAKTNFGVDIKLIR